MGIAHSSGPIVHSSGPIAHSSGPIAHSSGPIVSSGPIHRGYGGPLNLNTHLVAHPNGAVVPLDEPAVAAARADHFAAIGLPLPVGYGAGYGYAGYGLVGHPNGAVVPVDEPAVQAARADHFAAHELFGQGHY